MSNNGPIGLISERWTGLRLRMRHHIFAHMSLPSAHHGKLRSLSDCFILGTIKRGTTSLFSSLMTHPGILRPRGKNLFAGQAPLLSLLSEPVATAFSQAGSNASHPPEAGISFANGRGNASDGQQFLDHQRWQARSQCENHHDSA
jgi:hypothetical protein